VSAVSSKYAILPYVAMTYRITANKTSVDVYHTILRSFFAWNNDT